MLPIHLSIPHSLCIIQSSRLSLCILLVGVYPTCLRTVTSLLIGVVLVILSFRVYPYVCFCLLAFSLSVLRNFLFAVKKHSDCWEHTRGTRFICDLRRHLWLVLLACVLSLCLLVVLTRIDHLPVITELSHTDSCHLFFFQVAPSSLFICLTIDVFLFAPGCACKSLYDLHFFIIAK